MSFFGPPNVEKLQTKGDVKGLIKALGYKKDENIRIKSARALSRFKKDTRVIAPLVSALRDENGAVREAAEQALIIELHTQEMRRAIIEALGKIEDAHVVKPLLAALAYPDLGDTAAGILVKIGSPSVGPLFLALKHKDLYVRKQAAGALGEIGDVRAVEPLVKLLEEDKVYSVRQKVAEALETLGWQQGDDSQRALLVVSRQQWDKLEGLENAAVGPLLMMLQDDDYQVRQVAVKAFGKIENISDVNPFEVLLKDNDKGIRRATVKALAEIGDIQVVDFLIVMLEDTEIEIRITAAEALGEIGDVRAVEPLAKLLEDTSYINIRIRMTVVEALGKIGDVRAVEPLAKLLEDRDDSVRQKAFEVLKVLNWQPQNDVQRASQAITFEKWDELVSLGAAAVDPLALVLKETSTKGEDAQRKKTRRMAAVKTLGKIKDPRAIEPLWLAYSIDKDSDIRQEALKTLEQIDPQATVQLLVGSLQSHPNSKAVMWALEKVGDAQAIEPLIEALKINYGQDDYYSVGDTLMTTLVTVLERSAANVSTEELHGLTHLTVIRNVKTFYGDLYNENHPFAHEVAEEKEVKVDCSEVRRLARQELERRDLKV